MNPRCAPGREEQRQKEKQAREEQFRAEQTTKQKIRNTFSSQYGHLGVSSDEDIDKKVRELEFSQQHESLTIAEEKAVLKQIKQLQVSVTDSHTLVVPIYVPFGGDTF